MVKTILDIGQQDSGKPGKPFIVTVSFIGYLAKGDEVKVEPKVKTAEEVKQSLQDLTLHKPAPEVKFGLEELHLTAPETIIDG